MAKAIVSEFYEKYYSSVFSDNGSFSSYAYRSTHMALEKNLNSLKFPRVLEIGAGKAEHLSYVKHDFDEYVMVDLFEAPTSLLNSDFRYSWIKNDINQVDFEEASFDRILMMCVLHHLDDPYETLVRMNRWLKPGGLISIFLPSDPGILNRINRKLFVSSRSKSLGFKDYELVNALEHRNHVWSLKLMIKKIMFNYSIKTKWYPFGLPFPNLSLFSIWNLRKMS